MTTQTQNLEFGVAVALERYSEFLEDEWSPNGTVSAESLKVISPDRYTGSLIWLVYRRDKKGIFQPVLPFLGGDGQSPEISAGYDLGFWRTLVERDPDTAKQLENYLRRRVLQTVPQVLFVPPVRGFRIRPDTPGIGELPDSLREIALAGGGFGLRNRLSELANPGYGGLEKERRFEKVSSFVASLLGDESERTVRVPNAAQESVILDFGVPMPIDHLGKGSEDVLVIAETCLGGDQNLICIEEPEAHLHPALQRSLVRRLQEVTSNQYLNDHT